MSPALLFVVLMLSVAFWRHLASALVAGVVVLSIVGLMVLTQAASGGNLLSVGLV